MQITNKRLARRCLPAQSVLRGPPKATHNLPGREITDSSRTAICGHSHCGGPDPAEWLWPACNTLSRYPT